eukprot:962554_1
MQQQLQNQIQQMQEIQQQVQQPLIVDRIDNRIDNRIEDDDIGIIDRIGIGIDRIDRPISFSPILLNQLRNFFNSNSYVVETPEILYGVPINKSPLRRNGMNIISVDYSTSIPNPKQILQKNGQLVVFGPKTDTQNYLNNIGESTIKINDSNNSIRLP